MYINPIYVGQVALARALALSFTAERRAHGGAGRRAHQVGQFERGARGREGKPGKRTQIQVR